MPTISSINENSLKLTGNKIELTSRPESHQGTASARSALLGRSLSRPVSAIPLLNLDYNEFDVHVNTRRPLSADFPHQYKKSSYRAKLDGRFDPLYTDGTTSVESGEETEDALPSSNLLQNLLSEPLYSWRNGIRSKPTRKNKPFKKPSPKFCKVIDSIDTPSPDSDTSSSTESATIKPRQSVKTETVTINFPQPEIIIKPRQPENINSTENTQREPKCETEEKEQITSMVLVPGLKTKPPLPKKPDLKATKRLKSPSSLPNDENKSNFEKITLGMLNCDLMPPPPDINTIKPPENPNQESNTQASTGNLNSDEAIELKFQNWFQEEKKVGDAITESELNTDLSLHQLKLQSVVDKEFESIEKTDLKDQSAHISTLQTKVVSTSNKASVKTVNFEDFEEIKCKKKNTSKNFIKHNIKLTSKTDKKITSEVSNKPKFTPRQMHLFPDVEVTTVPEVESWMSSNADKTILETENPTPKTSYLDFLSKIDELQETCGDICLEDLPERDKDDTTPEQSDTNTYDDIVSLLHVLEEEDKKSQSKMESIKEIVNSELSSSESESYGKSRTYTPTRAPDAYNEHTDRICNKTKTASVHFKECERNIGPFLNFKNPIEKEIATHHTCCNECNCSSHCRNRDQEQPSRISISSTTNLNDIFSFLDEVDRNCSRSLACAKERIHQTVQVMDSNIKLDTIPKLEELLAYTNVELSNYIIDLSLRLKEKSSSIALLQKELSMLRDQFTKMSKDTNDIIKQRLKTQKEDYENIVKRHQKFIDQLIADKKTLNQQCEGLISEMKVLEDRFNSNLRAAEQRHKIEIQKVKEMHMAGEKIRRERWIDNKTQKIKELTVKGLEPELEKMASRHQQELTNLRALHKREIEDLELRGARKMQQQCEMLREQLTTEREKALVHEREVLRQRYEHLVESEEQNYQEQRRRLLAEHAHRIAECEERENAAIVEKDRAIKQVQSEFEDKLQAAMRRHNTELSVLKEKTELEMEAFRNNFKKQIAAQLSEKETQIRDKYRKERDKEIEAVIERLEMESSETKAQIEQTTENRMRRLKEKYEKEIKDLENSEKEATSKYSETKTKLLETEDQVITLKASVKQLEMQLNETKEISDKLSNERNKLKDLIREEMKQEIQALEKEVQELKTDKDKELQKVYARVKLAVARKDETLSELSRDNVALQEKCTYLENMLEQQRKEYLIK